MPKAKKVVNTFGYIIHGSGKRIKNEDHICRTMSHQRKLNVILNFFFSISSPLKGPFLLYIVHLRGLFDKMLLFFKCLCFTIVSHMLSSYPWHLSSIHVDILPIHNHQGKSITKHYDPFMWTTFLPVSLGLTTGE